MLHQLRQELNAINYLIDQQRKIGDGLPDENFGQFIYQTFSTLQGVASCKICLKYASRPFGDCGSKKCNRCNCLTDSGKNNLFECLLTGTPNTLAIPISFNAIQYGIIALHTNHDFSPNILNAIHAFVDALAIKLAFNLQKKELEIQKLALKDKLNDSYDFVQPTKACQTEALPQISDANLLAGSPAADGLLHREAISLFGLDLNEKRHREAIENMIEGCQIIGFDWKYLYLNQSAEKQSRRAKEELIGKRYMDVWPDAESTSAYAVMEHCMKERVSSLIQNEFHFPDGSVGWFELSIQPIPEGIFILSMDVTNRKLAEKALTDSEDRFRKAFVTSPDSININRMSDGLYVNINKGFTEIMGYTEEEIIGKTSLEKDIWVDSEDRINLVKGLKQNGFVTNLEARFRRKDGSISTGLMSASCIDLGGVPHILSITRDIGDLKKIREALEENEERFRRVFQEGLFSMVLCESNFNFIEVNDAFCSLLGYSEQELIGMSFKDITHPDHLAGDLEAIQKLYNGELKAYQTEKRYIRKDKQVVWGALKVSAMRNSEGEFLYFLAMINNISKRKKAEEDLWQSERRLSQYIEYSPIFTYIKEVTATESKVLNASRNFIEMTGVCQEEMIGKNMHQLYPKEFADKITAEDWNIISTGNIVRLEEEFGGRYYTTIKYPISHGDKTLLAGYTIDITDKKNYETELIRAKEKAEENDKLKTAFLANMSHEIRTPMNGILGFANLLKEPNLTGEDQQSYINLIEKSGARMLNIINDLVTISKVESGTVDLFLSMININEQLEFLCNFFLSEANQKNLELEVDTPLPYLQANFITDREKLFSILSNLIKNALKFTKRGKVKFGYRLKGNLIEFYVADTGIGIPEEKQLLVFDRFVQADTSLSRGYEGAGLGLSISKAYVEMLGGKIWVESVENIGSKFSFTLPAKNADPTIPVTELVTTEIQQEILATKTVLLADDDEDSRMYLSILLKSYGVNISLAETGQEAIDLCRTNRSIHLILMDIKMPVLDGYSAATQIKAFWPELPIVAQTAYALEGDKQKYGNVFDAYITKPIQASDLKNTIYQFLNLN